MDYSQSVVLILLAWMALAAPADAKSVQAAREQVVASTLKYLNVPYLWGGDHPKTGLDCSAFVRRVYADAGLKLPRVSRDQFAAAKPLRPKEVLPGDLIFFAMKHPGTARVDHIGVYVGRGFFVHASVTHGVHIETVTKPYFLARVVGVLKYPGF